MRSPLLIKTYKNDRLVSTKLCSGEEFKIGTHHSSGLKLSGDFSKSIDLIRKNENWELICENRILKSLKENEHCKITSDKYTFEFFHKPQRKDPVILTEGVEKIHNSLNVQQVLVYRSGELIDSFTSPLDKPLQVYLDNQLHKIPTAFSEAWTVHQISNNTWAKVRQVPVSFTPNEGYEKYLGIDKEKSKRYFVASFVLLLIFFIASLFIQTIAGLFKTEEIKQEVIHTQEIQVDVRKMIQKRASVAPAKTQRPTTKKTSGSGQPRDLKQTKATSQFGAKETKDPDKGAKRLKSNKTPKASKPKSKKVLNRSSGQSKSREKKSSLSNKFKSSRLGALASSLSNSSSMISTSSQKKAGSANGRGFGKGSSIGTNFGKLWTQW